MVTYKVVVTPMAQNSLRRISFINDEKLIVSVVEITHSNRSQESIERRVKG